MIIAFRGNGYCQVITTNRCIDATSTIDVVIAQGSFGIGQGNRSIDSHLDGLVVEGRSSLWLASQVIDFIDFSRQVHWCYTIWIVRIVRSINNFPD